MTLTENVVQSACADALAAYFHTIGITYRQLWTYANQQGERANQFCGDLVGVIDNSALLLLEFKSLNHQSGRLNSFRQDQFEIACKMENGGVPIRYCYDAKTPLAYYVDPRPRTWPEDTLTGINASLPSRLKGECPEINKHMSILYEIGKARGESAEGRLEIFGRAVGTILPNLLRNSFLAMVFGRDQVYAMDNYAINALHQWLISNPAGADQDLAAKINALMQTISVNTPKVTRKTKP